MEGRKKKKIVNKEGRMGDSVAVADERRRRLAMAGLHDPMSE